MRQPTTRLKCRDEHAPALTVDVMASRYDDSDAALARPMSAAELRSIIDDGLRPFMRDAGRLEHLLSRLAGTLVNAEQDVSQLRRRVTEQSQLMSRQGVATTLNPLDAVKFLDADQREAIFDSLSRAQLANLRALVDAAQRERAEAVDALAAAREAAAHLSGRQDLPPHVRAEVTRLLSRMPADVPEIHRPLVLDYPEPQPVVPSVPTAPAPVAAAPVAEVPTPAAGAPGASLPVQSAAAAEVRPPQEAAPQAYQAPYSQPEGAVFADPYAAPGSAYISPYAPRRTE